MSISTTLAATIAYTSDTSLGSGLVTDGASPTDGATYVLAGQNSTVTAAYATQFDTDNSTVTNSANATGALATDSSASSGVGSNGALALSPCMIPALLLLL